MKNEERQNKKVTSLAEYKKRRIQQLSAAPPRASDSDQESLLQQVSYHLVMAARAIANQKPRS